MPSIPGAGRPPGRARSIGDVVACTHAHVFSALVSCSVVDPTPLVDAATACPSRVRPALESCTSESLTAECRGTGEHDWFACRDPQSCRLFRGGCVASDYELFACDLGDPCCPGSSFDGASFNAFWAHFFQRSFGRSDRRMRVPVGDERLRDQRLLRDPAAPRRPMRIERHAHLGRRRRRARGRGDRRRDLDGRVRVVVVARLRGGLGRVRRRHSDPGSIERLAPRCQAAASRLHGA